MRTFFGFAVVDWMFSDGATITKHHITFEAAAAIVREGVISCCDPSHASMVATLRVRFGIEVSIREKAPQVTLLPGDRLVVLSVREFPRVEGQRDRRVDEIEKGTLVERATFVFSVYTVACVPVETSGPDSCVM